MKLKSFGCSFIFGSDLADDGRDQRWPTGSLQTWPAILARHLQRDYQCYARPGSGNLQILEHVLNQANLGTQDDLFVIGWTWIDRFDWYDINYDTSKYRTPWKTILPGDTSDTAEMYYKKLHAEYQDKFTNLCYIKLAIDVLQQKNIPFFMTYMDELMFDQTYHTTPAVLDLQKSVKPFMNKFENLTFLEWSRQNGFEESPQWHPLEQAHAAAAQYVIELFKQKSVGCA